MTLVSLLHEAEIELWEAVAYYEEKAPGLGLDFAAEIESVIQELSIAPDRWPLRPDGTRRCLTQRFPYMVVYTLNEQSLWVIAISHCKRQPGYWADRK